MEKLDQIISRHMNGGQSVLPYDKMTMMQLKVDTINTSEGTLTGYDCPKCRNRGYMAVGREDGSYFIRDCSCMPMRRCFRQMELSGLQKTIRELTFDTFDARTSWQKTLKQGAIDYARDPKGWFMIGGQSGCGKTHLCTAICREILLRGKSLLYMPWREYIGKIKALPFENRERIELMDKCKNMPYLYIDDLFKTGKALDGALNPTQADVNLAFEILNYRYLNRLTTILSSEILPMDLLDVDEATGSRVIEMCGGHVYSISPGKEKNYRLRNIITM